MKKIFIWLGLGAAALTGCTSSEVVDEPQGNAIGFENVIKKNSRSEGDGPVQGDLTSGSFNKFFVYGYYVDPFKLDHPISVFSGDEVRQNADKSEWTYDNIRYWIPGNEYNFYAYSCADIALADDKGSIAFDFSSPTVYQEGEKDNEATLGNRSLKINKYLCNSEHQHDLVCSFVEGIIGGNQNQNGTVGFTFRHALSKVSVEFQNELPSLYDVEIKDVKITNFYDQANLDIRMLNGNEDLAKNAWTGQNRSSSAPTIDITMSAPVNNKYSSDAVFMLPAAYGASNLGVEFTIIAKEGVDNAEEFVNRRIKGTFGPTWHPGKAYKYIIHLTGATAQFDPIMFAAQQNIDEASVWSEEEPVDISFAM